jgi:hypothetical protein
MGVFQRFFRGEEPAKDMDILRVSIRDSFGRVASDVSQLKTWVVHLHQLQGDLKGDHVQHKYITQKELQELTQKINKLEGDQVTLAKYLSDMVVALQQKAQFESEFVSKLNKFESELELIKNRRQERSEPTEKIGSVRTKSEPEFEFDSDSSISAEKAPLRQGTLNKIPRSSSVFEEKALRELRTHRKEYVLRKILDTLESDQFSTNALEEVIVERKGLCGRTSFFAYVKELRLQGLIDDVLVGKRKILAVNGKIAKKTER